MLDKTKTTQNSGLTDYELELLSVVDEIKWTKSTRESIKILERFIDKHIEDGNS